MSTKPCFCFYADIPLPSGRLNDPKKHKALKVDQQPIKSAFPSKGKRISWTNGTSQLACIVAGKPRDVLGTHLFSINVINTRNTSQVPKLQLSKVTQDMPYGALSHNPFNNTEILGGYWHHCLNHLPLVNIRRMAERGAIASCLSDITRIPPCAAESMLA